MNTVEKFKRELEKRGASWYQFEQEYLKHSSGESAVAFIKRGIDVGDTFNEILSSAFYWPNTYQGVDYWCSVATDTPLVVEEYPVNPSSNNNTCTCTSRDLFAFGCVCGYFKEN